MKITLKRHGVNDYFTVEGMPENTAAILQGRFLEIDKAKVDEKGRKEWHRAESAQLTREQAAEIRNGIVTRESALNIAQAIRSATGATVKVNGYVESYFVGSKWQGVEEWLERQKNDHDIAILNGEILDVTDWTLTAANENGLTPSIALQYDRRYYDALLPALAAKAPHGSFSVFCYLAHFGYHEKDPRKSNRNYTLEELADILTVKTERTA